MSPTSTATSVPKQKLVEGICKVIPEESIRTRLQIRPKTSLEKRLQGFTKAELLGVLTSTSDGEQALRRLEQDYVLSSPPTLYLMKLQGQPDPDGLIAATAELARLGMDGSLVAGDADRVRAVYLASPAVSLGLGSESATAEVPLYYEHRLEYTECEPKSPDYGKRKDVYSLERAFIWLVEGHSHAVICASDFAAVRPVIHFGISQLGLSWVLPDLTQDMMNRLAARAEPRTATFSTARGGVPTFLDVQTVTVSDPDLAGRSGFTQIRRDPNRQQTAGFYTKHPYFDRKGLGIARRYGRVWTPALVGREDLVRLAITLIEKAEEELSHQHERDPRGYVRYHHNVAVTINGREIKGRVRRAFDDLMTAVLRAYSGQSREDSVERDLVRALVKHQRPLGLTVLTDFECPECGDTVIGSCPDCRVPYVVTIKKDSRLVVKCPKSSCVHRPDVDGGFVCECGQEVPLVALENHLVILPRPECMAGVRQLLGAMSEVTWDGFFCIAGFVLKLLRSPDPPFLQIVRLDDLRLWREKAEHRKRSLPYGREREALLSILDGAKEKCRANNGHPTHEICTGCVWVKGRIPAEQVKRGEVCLPRILGLPIGKPFDGVHHGREVADVRYEDAIAETGQAVKLALHLKSRTRPRPQGIGRNVSPVKALYTQLFYSVYLAMTGRAEIDVVGVSIPNTIHEDVVASWTRLANELGFPLVVVDENEWLKIVDAVVEQ